VWYAYTCPTTGKRTGFKYGGVSMVPLLADAVRAARAVRPRPDRPTAVAYEWPGLPPVTTNDLVFRTERGELFADLGPRTFTATASPTSPATTAGCPAGSTRSFGTSTSSSPRASAG
jgi:hypothetical protein